MYWKDSAGSVLCLVLLNIHNIDLDEKIGTMFIQFSNDTNLFVVEYATLNKKIRILIILICWRIH